MRHFILLLILGVLGIHGSTGQELKIAVVDMTALFEAHPDTQTAETLVEKQRKEAGEKIKELTSELKKTLDSYNKVAADIRRAGESAKEKQKQEADDLATRARQLEREVADAQSASETTLENSLVVERKKILAKVSAAIKAYNEKAGYQLVLDTSATSFNGLPIIADVRDLPDITQAVKKTLTEKSAQR